MKNFEDLVNEYIGLTIVHGENAEKSYMKSNAKAREELTALRQESKQIVVINNTTARKMAKIRDILIQDNSQFVLFIKTLLCHGNDYVLVEGCFLAIRTKYKMRDILRRLAELTKNSSKQVSISADTILKRLRENEKFYYDPKYPDLSKY
jgi:RNase P subunit RPR2